MQTAVSSQGAHNRRSSPRIALKFPIHYRPQDGGDDLLQGRTQDMSVSGLSFLAKSKLDVGSNIRIFLDEQPGNRNPCQVSGVVTGTEVWGENTFRIGAKFLNLDEEIRSRIMIALQHSDTIGLLRQAAQTGASDLHLSADHPPIARIAGELRPLREERLSGPDLRDMIFTIMDDEHRRVFDRDLELDFSLSIDSTLRYRVNVHMQRGNVEAAFRRIEPAAHTFQELNLPIVLKRFAELRTGLVLVTGPTGAGKSTTVAAIVDHINSTRAAVIVTLESPIEYVYTYKKSIIKQREIGVDTRSYPAALREAMRQDPDVIVIGEVRDQETMESALNAAETGHLVLATFPAANCVQSILRTFHFFTRDRQQEIQLQLANCLKGIISLRLLAREDKPGVIPATEILVCTDAIANMIRSGALEQIESAIQTGATHGMHSMASSLDQLRKTGRITPETVAATLARRL